MTFDVADKIWALFGTAVHKVLESSKEENIVEERLYAEMNKWTISGAIDVQTVHDDRIDIQDYKTTSVWSVLNDKPEWEYQLNCYSWLVYKNKKKKTGKLQIVTILRDWQRSKAIQEGDYPKAPIVVIDIPVWSVEKQEMYIKTRTEAHQQALYDNDFNDSMIECTSHEQWERESSYAIKKGKNKRALKVFKDLGEAEKYLGNAKKMGMDVKLEERKGEKIRCQGNYCGVSEWCEQYQATL